MVQAILEGRKTQTRRVVKPQPPNDYDYLGTDTDRSSGEPIFYACWEGDRFHNIKCPYGNPGDILWVRETWARDVYTRDYVYKASADVFHSGIPAWKPSIHMPREACRLFLRITNVRVERLHDITQQDALSEGIHVGETINNPITGEKIQSYKNYLLGEFKWMSPVLSFKTLWYKINGAESWNANPWVWVVEFEQINREEVDNV
jgi:hypothetical protein